MAEKRGLVLASHDGLRQSLSAALRDEKCQVVETQNEAGAYRQLVGGVPDVVVMQATGEPGEDREAFLVGLLATRQRPPVVVVSGDSSADVAARLVRRGAFSALRYPVDREEARGVLRRALKLRDVERERSLLLVDLNSMRTLVHDALSNLLDGVLVVDNDVTVLFANDEAARILLADPDSLVGRPLDPTFCWSLYAMLRAARDSPTRQSAREFDLHSQQKRLPVLGRASVIHDHEGKPAGTFIVLRCLDPSKPGVAQIVQESARKAAEDDEDEGPPPEVAAGAAGEGDQAPAGGSKP